MRPAALDAVSSVCRPAVAHYYAVPVPQRLPQDLCPPVVLYHVQRVPGQRIVQYPHPDVAAVEVNRRLVDVQYPGLAYHGGNVCCRSAQRLPQPAHYVVRRACGERDSVPRHPVCDHPERHAARIAVCHLGNYARIVASLVWKAGLGIDVLLAAGAAARVYGVARGDGPYRAHRLGDVSLYGLCYGEVVRAALGAGVRGVLLEFCGFWPAGAALVALLPPARFLAAGRVLAVLPLARFCGFIISIILSSFFFASGHPGPFFCDGGVL